MADTTTHAAEPTRRDFLFIATGVGAVVGGALTLWPFVQSLAPDRATKAAGAPAATVAASGARELTKGHTRVAPPTAAAAPVAMKRKSRRVGSAA